MCRCTPFQNARFAKILHDWNVYTLLFAISTFSAVVYKVRFLVCHTVEFLLFVYHIPSHWIFQDSSHCSVETKGSSPHFNLLASSMSLNPWNNHLSSGTEGSSSFFSKLLSQQHMTSKICDIPCIQMGSSLINSPKQSFVFLDGVSVSPRSVSCHSLYKHEAPTLDSASLFIRCRQDISPMHKSPIWTGFDPPDVPRSLCI